MVRSSPGHSPSPSYPVCESRRFTSRRLPDGARQTMVKPIRVDGRARDHHRTQPELITQTRRDCRMVLQPCDGVIAVDAAGRTVAPRLRALSLSLGNQHHRRIRCPRCHFIWCHHLLICPRCGVILRELPVSNSRCPHLAPYILLHSPHPPTYSPFGSLHNRNWRL